MEIMFRPIQQYFEELPEPRVLLAAAGSPTPPPPGGGGNGPSNLNDLSVYSKYMKKFAKDVRNKLPDLDLKYFNKQNLTKYLKYLA